MMKKDVSVVIPVYKNFMSESEKVSFNRTLEIFRNRDIYLVGPAKLKTSLELFSQQQGNISVTVFANSYFKTILGYNRLLMNSEFYLRFSEYTYILICQLDVFVIKDDLDFWIKKGKDNIGAPIFEGYTKPTFNFKQGNNGGFCLRKTNSCIKVLSQIKITYSPLLALWKMEKKLHWKVFRILRDGFIFNYNTGLLKPVINEDIFWSVIVPDKFYWFKATEPEVAKYFAFDANPEYLFKKCDYQYPMAIHAWLRYDKLFTNNLIQQF